MLRPGELGAGRTAAGSRRRPRLAQPDTAGLGLLALLLAGCFGGVSERPTERRLAEKVAAQADRHQPEASRGLRALLRQAEEIEAEEKRAPIWRRRGGRVEAAWGRVTARAAETHRAIRRARRSATMDWLTMEKKLEEALMRARSEIADPGLGRREAYLLSQASTHAGEARRLAAAGLHAEAVRSGERALAATGSIHHAWQGLHARFRDAGEISLWRSMVEESLREARREGRTLLVVDKLRRRLEVFRGGRLEVSFAAELGTNGLARKLHSGDQATPEGRYRVISLKGPRETRYHLALLLDYPNAEDRSRWLGAVRRGSLTGDRGPGGLIEIHGEGGRGRDWTDGCVALANSDMERLFGLVQVGTPVTIVGTWSPQEVAW